MTHLLHDLLSSSADVYPNRVAVVDREHSMSYAELEAASSKQAELLSDVGVEPGDRVGIYLDKSLEAVVGIYGTLKAGGVYVPLDPRAPAARLGYIARDCGIQVLISDTRHAKKWPALIEEGAPIRTVFVPDADQEIEASDAARILTRADLEACSGERPPVRRIDEDLAYILYTSGSTGAPKGVMLSHRNGMGFIEWAARALQLEPDDRLSSHAPFHFDLSIFDMFAAALSGASVHLVPQAISVFPVDVARFIDEHGITVWYSVPSILSLLTQHGNLATGDLPTLRHVVFAGEVFPTKYLSGLMGLLPEASFHNWYGPTETNVCTAYTVPEAPDPGSGDIPIGSSIDNVATIVVKTDGAAAAPGEEGELHVRGATVMHGYWGDREKTAGKLKEPEGEGSSDRVYATGDLVIETASGHYEFLGRKDHQIKSRGYRIELGEIESAIHAHPGVAEAVVVAVPDETISNRIWAYVSATGADEVALRSWCAERIPKYMIPERFEFISSLPRTSTGKIDRQEVEQISLAATHEGPV